MYYSLLLANCALPMSFRDTAENKRIKAKAIWGSII